MYPRHVIAEFTLICALALNPVTTPLPDLPFNCASSTIQETSSKQVQVAGWKHTKGSPFLTEGSQTVDFTVTECLGYSRHL